MSQADQFVDNNTFPSVRTDINDNIKALFSQSSGNSAPTVKVAYQPWVDTSSSPPVWKIWTGSAWLTVGVLDPANFQVGGVTQIANGGTGATTAAAALAALLPSQTGNAGKALVTSGSAASWDNAQGAKAWVNFNGTGTVAIRASYNVSSITDNGVGDYTVNFATAMADANYAAVAMGLSGTAAYGDSWSTNAYNTAPVAGSIRISNTHQDDNSNTTTFKDSSHMFLAIFR